MERARWNTELSHKKLNFVICPTFWGHIKSPAFFCIVNWFMGVLHSDLNAFSIR